LTFPPIAHGIVSRADLPIPEWLFAWAAAMVLVVSFIGLAVLWPEPKLRDPGWRALPRGLGRVLSSRPAEVLFGAIGVGLLALTIYAGLAGVQSSSANFTPTFVYVIFWLGLVPLSVLFGDVFRAFNPWRAIGRGVAWLARFPVGGELPKPLPYPERLGHWPAATGLILFALLELVASGRARPENIAIATIAYSAATFVGMSLYGVEAWCRRGEAFSVYFNLFARMSPFECRGRELGVRKPLSGLPALEAGPGTVAVLAAMIGTVTFDGASEAPIWTGVAVDISDFFGSLGLPPARALEASFAVGLAIGVLLVAGLYWLGTLGARSVGGGFSAQDLRYAFVHTLVPIALAYVAAHYFTLLLFQSQALAFLVSDPLGDGSDLFGTADRGIDYSLIGSTATWYWQVAFVVGGHVMGLMLAHDRALVMYEKPRLAVLSQCWMLLVMVLFTCLALWLLSQANA
jgi:hypothetical protein